MKHTRFKHHRTALALAAARCCAIAATMGWLAPPVAVAQTRPPVTFAGQLPRPAFALPQPFTRLMRDPANRGFATPLQGSAAVTWKVEGRTATLDQGSAERVLLNWQSFDIAEGYTVRFIQDKDPAKYVSALNRVWGDRPSVIQGALVADREVIVQNPQGVHFGATARVAAGKLVATTLAVSDAVYQKGIRNITDASPVFTSAGTDHWATDLNSAVTVEAGAEITTAAGGDVLLVAPRVVNQGRIETPQGQTVLAAGDKVYLMSSSDPAQRGLIVAVDPVKLTGSNNNDPSLGVVENAAAGTMRDATSGLVKQINEIRADGGSVNLVGLIVRQNGHVNATTAVKGANGAIYLQAMASTTTLAAAGTDGAGKRGLAIEAGATVRVTAGLGSVQFGAGSVTAVRPDAGSATQLDAEAFTPSAIRAEGQTISVAAGALISAPSGTIALLAARNADGDPIFEAVGGTGRADDSRLVIAPGARLDVAGLRDVPVDGARNQGSLRLFRIELADSPVQRGGPLYRSAVYFDLRDASKISLANVGGTAAALGRTAAERSTAGGSIRLSTNGALVVGDGATLHVSGGSVAYSAASLQNSLLSQDGRVVSFRAGAAGSRVDALLSGTQQTLDPGYTEGAGGGTLLLSGRQIALAGDIDGHVVQGERQRDGRSARAAPSQLSLGQRDGSSYYLSEIRLAPGAPAAIDPTIFTNPLQPVLPGLANGIDLSLAKVAQGGFGGLVLRGANVVQVAPASLDLGIGGSFDIEARTVSLDGSVRAPGGRVSIVTPTAEGNADVTGDGDIRLSSSTRLDVAGLWTNDTAGGADVDAGAGAGAGASDRQLDGGSVQVRSAHSLRIEPGAAIDVSGGARLSASGALSTGKAGAVSLTIGTNPLLNPRLDLAGLSLEAFDFAQGGRLTLGTPALTLGAAPPGAFTLASSFFSEAGFGSIALSAAGDIRLLSGTQLAPRLLNWQLESAARAQPSGSMSSAVASAQRIDAELAEAQPVSLTLAASRPLLLGGAGVLIERGASIDLDAGATLNLSASRGIDVGASGGRAGLTSGLSAPGGSIQLALTGPRGSLSFEDGDGFIGSQAIWLGSDARLSVDGIARLRRESAGSGAAPVQFGSVAGAATPLDERRVGSVLGGGSITLNAARGYVVSELGSSLSLNGASATLNFPGLPAAVQVAKAAGTLTVSTPEGFALDGAVSAQPPRDAAGRALADGGRLTLSIGTGGVLTTTENAERPYPTTPRALVVGEFDGWLRAGGARPGDDLSPSLGNGVGAVRSTLLQAAGFDALQLAAGDVVRFETTLVLNAPLGLQLNAPAIAALPGRQVSVAAGSALLGDAVNVRRGQAPAVAAVADTSAAQDTLLAVSAPTIEVVGNLGLQGFSAVALDASVAGTAAAGEIRFGATAASFGRVELLSRTLRFGGLLSLNAGQVYATSASRYSLVGLPGSRVVVSGGADDAAPPLSAFAALSINATDIEQRGNLRQPFGQITLAAENTLTLGEGSSTSVAGDGARLIYGDTLNLAEWLLPGGNDFFALAQDKGIRLGAARVVTAASARVSAGGGGVVLASEFFPGVGGSRDYFQTAGLFAVLPDYAGSRALSGTGGIALTADGQAAARELVVTMPGSGLAPGRYTVLPARYALLAGELPQGAFLVSRAADQGRTVLRSPIAQDDGSVVVTGYLATPGSVSAGVPGERFVVEPAATFNAKSDVRLTDVSGLLAQRAATLGTARPAVPNDGGLLQIGVTGSGQDRWQARLDLQARGGLAGELDVSARHLVLVDDLSKTPAGTLGISAEVVARSGAGSVLLGGLRSRVAPVDAADTPGWVLDASASRSVAVDLGNTELKVGELLLASRGSVELAPGTRITATANANTRTAPRGWAGDGEGALAVVSAQPVDWQRRDATPGSGDLRVGAGSVLSGAQVGLDATGAASIDASVRLPAQALSLGARRIVVGEGAPADDNATVLLGELLSTVRAAPDLQLRAYSSIDFVGAQDWAGRPAGAADGAPKVVAKRLALDAPAVRGLSAAGGAAARTDIAAESIVVSNSSGLASGAAPGQGSLVLQAIAPLRSGQTGGLTLGPGSVDIGFDNASLRSTGDIVLSGAAGSGVQAQDALTLSAARMMAGTGAEHRLGARGTLRIAVEPGSRTLAERAGQGASVSMQAARVQQDGVIDLPGGRLDIQALGAHDANDAAIAFGAGSSISVAGFALQGPDGFAAFGAAGAIQARAFAGRIDLFGTLDASAARRADGSAGQGSAGSLTLRANGAGGELRLSQGLPDGTQKIATLLGRAGTDGADLGGRLTVEVSGMASADGLARAATQGGLTREFSLRVGAGDVALDESVSARRIEIAADGGRLVIGAASTAALKLDAAAPAGGVVQLAAGGDLVLAPLVRIDARSARSGAQGGDVLLASRDGRITLGVGASVDAGGDDADDGRIVLRAARGDDGGSVRVERLDAQRLSAGEVAIEGVRVYDGIDTLAGAGAAMGAGVLTQATLRADNNAFMAARSNVLAALGVTDDDAASRRVNLRAGVEVRSLGDLTLAGDWSFAGTASQPNLDRPGGDGGFLTLRAVGSLRLDANLNDGFTAPVGASALRDLARAWSYRLVAGADVQAANPLALRGAPSAAGAGDLVIAADRAVRTGAGSIELAASRDVVFAAGDAGAASGKVYVAGRPLADLDAVRASLFAGQSAKPLFTERGGRLTVFAARDVLAPEATQLVGNWFWRSGTRSTRAAEGRLYAAESQLAWWSEPGRFEQSLGSFGGGNLELRAGRDIVNVQAMAPSAGYADARDVASARLRVLGGGDLTVSAGRDLLGGQFFAGRGAGLLEAGGSVGVALGNQQIQAPVLVLMDGAWRVSARSGLVLGGIFNPTAVPTWSEENRPGRSGFFYTYGESAALQLVSNAGRINLRSGLTENQGAAYGLDIERGSEAAFQVLPPTLSVTAAGGDIDLLSGDGLPGAILFPSAGAQLRLWSGGTVRLGGAAGGRLAMSDSDPSAWPQASSPARRDGNPVTDANNGLIAATFADSLPLAGLHAADSEPVRIHAEGSLRIEGVAASVATLLLPASARLSAGEDVVGLSLRTQNLASGDVTRITAGRNLLAQLLGSVEVAGPGVLEIEAGGSIDLGASAGISTTGNQRNPQLPSTGASVRIAAATAGVLNLDELAARYLAPASMGGSVRYQSYRASLLEQVRSALKAPLLGYDEALAAFKTFPVAAQAAFGRQLLRAEFAAVYLQAPEPDLATFKASLERAFERRKADLLSAGDAALAAGSTLTLPGREVLRDEALATYLATLRRLAFSSLDLEPTLATRVASLARVRQGWLDAVAAGRVNANDSNALDSYRTEVLAIETASAGAAASNFGRLSLPMRLALFDQGFAAAELAGAGSFAATAAWPGPAPLLAYAGGLDMTQSSVVTRRGGGISLVNAGGAINVGLKDPATAASTGPGTAKGVIALGGGNIFALARDDFQVNTQRVFIVGEGDMTIWSSKGDIDSGRGANTAVAAPPLAPRRSADGVVFEVPATTAGSGLGILADAQGRRSGSIGLYPALGEILALDAFIRAPSVVLGSTIQGADNLISASVGGAAAAVPPPAVNVVPPAASNDSNTAAAAATGAGAQTRQRNALLTVELLGLGASEDEPCDEKRRRAGECREPPR